MSSSKKKVRIALLGCGVVGGGVLRLLQQNSARLSQSIGAEFEVAHVLVRDSSKARVAECEDAWVTTDPEVIFADTDIDVVVELMGGEQPAAGYVMRAFEAGCGVVSANKFLLAKRGPELLAASTKAGVDLAFEAAVGGAVPIIRTLRDSLTGDRVRSVHGLLNGTCNYILTRMREEGSAFEAILKDAQELGYAEAEPSLDVDGHDAAQKLVVLSMLAFGASISDTDVHVEGIRSVDSVDFQFAERLGFSIKHVAVGIERGERLELRVHPAFVPLGGQLASINGVLNGAFIQGEGMGPCLLVGQGAGSLPTAVSVVADLVDVARARVAGAGGVLSTSISPKSRELVPMGELVSRYYLRFDVKDKLGVLALIATALGEQGVSVENLVQEGRVADGGTVSMLIITHACREGDVRAALGIIAKSSSMSAAPRLIRIEEV